MTDKDINVITLNLKSLSIADLSRILGEGLVQTLSSLGHSITKNFLIEAILKIKGTGIFSSKIIRDHFAELAETEVINSWSGAKKCKELLQYFDLSEAFLPSSKSSRKISAETEPGFILHGYQDHIKREVSNFLIKETDKNKLMVQLPTGAGKTSLAMESIYDFFRIAKDCKCIVWMAHTDELCEQAVESFIRGWQQKGTFKVRIIRLWGGRDKAVINEIQDDTPTFVVTSFQSANSMLSTSSNEVMLAFTKIRSKTRLLVVDEAHNFVSRIVNKLNVKGNSVSVEIYKKIITADNCNVVMLTGTPLINYPNELGVLFNLVSGCNQIIQMRCVHDKQKIIDIQEFKKALSKLENIDYITYLENTNTLKIMRNPYGFVNEQSGKIKYSSGEKTSIKEFKEQIVELLQDAGYQILGLDEPKNEMIRCQKKFPDTKESFDNIFIDRNGNGLKNKQYFQTIIAGLVSYVGDKKELMPTIVPSGNEDDIFIETVEMTENVMKHYDIARAIERALDTKMRKEKKKNDEKDGQTSSYKIFSRAACNFV